MTRDELTHLIYQAAEQPELWNRVVDAVTRRIGAQVGVLFYSTIPPIPGRFDTVSVQSFPAESVSAYLSYFGARDIRIDRGKHLIAGALYVDDITAPFRDVEASEIYRDFYWPHRLGHCAAAVLFREKARAGILSIHRAADAGAFASRDIARLGAVAPHVIRALQWQRQLGRAREATGVLASALDRFAVAVLLVRPDRTLIHANEIASNLLAREGGAVRLSRGKVVAAKTSADSCLQAHVAQAVAATLGATPPPILRLPDSTGTLALLIVAPPVPADSGQTIMIFASHDADRLRPQPELLQQAFGLSSAEAAIAAALAEGDGPDAISERRGGALSTVRTQIKHVMVKLGVRRQSELVSLVARSVASARRPGQE